MTNDDVTSQRLFRQRLAGLRCESPQEVVSWMGAMQAQDFAGAKWSIGMRMSQATDAAIVQAFNSGAILRAHLLRPTWHFVAPADIRWMQELTGPRVNTALAGMYRRLNLDEPLLKRSNDLIARTMQGGKALTRLELGQELEKAGIQATGMRLLFIIHRLERDMLLCSGPLRGKQFTYMLLDERAPQACSLSYDEALAELTGRYIASRGPATPNDFSWWSGLPVSEAKRGLEMLNSQLDREQVDGQVFWFPNNVPPEVSPGRQALLLPTFDEFLIGYSGFDKGRDGNRVFGEKGSFLAPIVIDGKVGGSWRHSLGKKMLTLELSPFEPLNAELEQSVLVAARRYAEFLGLPLIVQ
jgi:hypothetical protein